MRMKSCCWEKSRIREELKLMPEILSLTFCQFLTCPPSIEQIHPSALFQLQKTRLLHTDFAHHLVSLLTSQLRSDRSTRRSLPWWSSRR